MKMKIKRPAPEERAISRDQVFKVSRNLYEKQMARYEHPAFEAMEDINSPIYGGVYPQRRQEIAYGGIVQEDRNATANLSMTPIIKELPSVGFSSNWFMPDTVDGDKD